MLQSLLTCLSFSPQNILIYLKFFFPKIKIHFFLFFPKAFKKKQANTLAFPLLKIDYFASDFNKLCN